MGKLVIVVIHTKKQHANVKIRILNIAPGDCTWWVPGFEVVTFSVCSLFFFFFFQAPLSFLFSKLNSPSSLGLSSHGTSDRLGSLLGTHSVVPKSLMLGRPSMDTALQIQVSGVGDHFPWPLLPLRPSMLLASFATRAHHWPMFNWMATRTQGPSLHSNSLVRGLSFYCCIAPCITGERAEPITNK